ncbi:MAG: hypothetical protein CO170_04570 [candidate division SR1 bacterium CG_4_9_14_3_um_filter_40_9]|nr:MAG: hypothetical protein CO170_04570 [candidate division SR1 bacterium CG_4_9_14_3_um_filter_40_9]
MSLLQFIVLVAGIVFIIFGVDIYKRKKMNILHFLIFVLGGAAIAMFALNQSLLDRFGGFFGIARGADLLVYIALILLFYFYMELVNKHTKDRMQLTRLISQIAINEAYADSKDQLKNRKNTLPKNQFIFNLRVYNEAQMVGKVIDEIYAAGFSKIVAINDGSSDDTLSILQEKKQQYPDKLLIIASHTINRGGGAANQTGFNFIRKYRNELQVQWMVTYDADGQMNIKDMEIFQSHMSHHPAQVYLGSRFLKSSKVENMPFIRKIILRISRAITLVFYGAKVSDPHNGYRVISMEALQKINITADGMHYANELQEQIKKNKLSFHEVPVHIVYTEYSMTKAHRQKNSNSLKLAIEMIYKKIFFR